MREGYLLLEDGRRFDGMVSGGALSDVPPADDAPGIGEVVFQTGMTGYQEVVTDPSYRGQIVAFTASHIGNVGVNRYDSEACTPALAGMVVRSLCGEPSSWRSKESFPAYLARTGVPCLSEVDTRALTRHIREGGALRGVLVGAEVPEDVALRRVRMFPGLLGRDLVAEVIPAESDGDWRGWKYAGLDADDPALVADELAMEFPAAGWFARVHGGAEAGDERTRVQPGPRVTLIHCGMKEGIDAGLRRRGARVRIVRPDVTRDELLRGDPDLVFLSNGPGDPDALGGLIDTVRGAVGRVPILGICLGFQVLALALGARTYKMNHGHHGINHPVLDKRTGRVLVTSQNHGFAVDGDSLTAACPDAVSTHVSLNDGTCEGFAVPSKRIRAVQFHPEARGGPHDARSFFRNEEPGEMSV